MTIDQRRRKSYIELSDIAVGVSYTDNIEAIVRTVVSMTGRTVTYSRPGKVGTLTVRLSMFAKWAQREVDAEAIAKIRGKVPMKPHPGGTK